MLCVVVGAAAGPLLAQAQTTAGSCTGSNASANYIQGLTLDGPYLDDWTPSAMHWDSGLVWQRCAQGMAFDPDTGRCDGAATVNQWFEWAETKGFLPLSFSGQEGWNIAANFSSNLLRSGGWRLPYKDELLALHTECTGSPAINAQVFPDTPREFFATASPALALFVWRIETNASPAATTTAITASLSARLVRGGQPFANLPQPSYATNGNTGQVTTFAPITLAPSFGATAPEGIAWGGVRITGEGSPQLRVNDWGDWVSEAIVRSGDEVAVRLSAPATPGATASATLTLRSGQTTGTSASAGNGGAEATALQEITTRFSVTSVDAPAAQACTDQRVLYVAPDGTSIGPAGSDWSNPASLQHALGIANGDTGLATCYQIHLKQGIYKPDSRGNVSAHFAIDRPLQLLGGYTGNPANPTERQLQANNTVLSGDIDNNDTVNAQGITEVARFHADGTPAASNQIQGDNSTRVLVIGGLNDTLGNGVYSAHPSEASYTVLEGLSLTGGGGDVWGGALLCNGAGAGRQCSPLLRQLRFSGNRAHIGGGLYNNGQAGGVSSPQMDSVTFSGNWAGFGAAMANDGQSGTSSPTIVNTTFSGNHAGSGGGGAMDNNNYLGVSSPRIHHSTFSGNQAVDGSAIQGGAPVVSASIFWGNVGALFESIKRASSVTDSIVQGGRKGTGNLNIDPLLGPLQDNGGATQTLMPGAGSPAIDALACTSAPSTDQRGTARPQGYGCDIGAVEAPASSYTAPGAPTGISASAGNGSALVQWSAPASNGGGAIAGYTVTSSGGQTCTATPPATSCTVTGLSNGTAYTFTVVATNSSGASVASAASATVTPMAAAIDGVCGSAHALAVLVSPSSNLCSVGTASSVTRTAAAFSWNCTGSHGGTTAQCSAPRQYSIAASAQPSAGGSATCAASTVAQGASVTCTATANAGYLFQEWTGACAGQALACSLSNVTAHQTSAALFAQQTTGLTLPEGPESGQSLGLLLQHSAAHWTIGSASTATVAAVVASSGIGLPSNVQLPYGLVSLQLVSGTVGSSASVVLTYPQALPADAKYYKLGKTAANPSPHWYEFSGAVVSGNTVTLTLTDGGAGDNDLNRDGNIDDPGGPAVVRAAPPPPPPPPPPSLVRLQVSISGAGAVQRSVAGSVIGTPGSTTTVEYLEGQSVTLTPQPEAGARFSGWMGACSGLLPCTLTLRSNQAAQATFTSAPAPSSCRSNVFSDDEERLLDAYLAYFGRPADVAGLAYWVAQLAGKGGRLDTIVDGFGNSQEFENRFGHMSAEQLIANLYQQMYGRAPDAQGAAFFMAQLASGQSSLAAIALHIFDGRQGSDRTVADNRKKVARYFVTRFEELGSAAPASLDGDSWSRLLADVGAEEASVSAGCAGVDSLLAGPALR